MRNLFVVLVVLGIFLSGCAAPKELTIDDHGSRVRLSEGKTVLITLEANRKAGYEWTLAELDEAILRQVGETEYVEKGVMTPDACCDAIFTFEGIGVGESGLMLEYHKADEAPEKTFVITVMVE